MTLSQVAKTQRDFYQRGRLDEDFVMNLLESRCGGKCYRGTRTDDIDKHIDFFWDSPKKGTMGIDVKGIKKAKRNDSEYSDDIHWIEAQNVKGNKGWIYTESKYIAFRTMKDILFVQPQKLIAIYEEKVKGKPVVTSTPKDCYVPYKRSYWGKDDISFKIPTDTLREMAHFVITI